MAEHHEAILLLIRARQSGFGALAIAPATVVGVALIRCGCSQAAWAIEIVAAVIFSLWIVASRP